MSYLRDEELLCVLGSAIYVSVHILRDAPEPNFLKIKLRWGDVIAQKEKKINAIILNLRVKDNERIACSGAERPMRFAKMKFSSWVRLPPYMGRGGDESKHTSGI